LPADEQYLFLAVVEGGQGRTGRLGGCRTFDVTPTPYLMSRLLPRGLLAVWCLAVGVWTAPVFAAEKSAGDVAYDAFAKVRDNRDAKPNAAHFEKLGQAGISFLIQHPTHRRAGSVISRSVDYLPGKENQATRAQWLAQLRLAVVHATFDANLGNDAKAALLALDAAIAGAEVRDRPTRDNVGTYRERIDKLAKQPGGQRFLGDQEMNFAAFLAQSNPRGARAHLEKLAAGSDKRTADRARDELNLMEVREKPLDLQVVTMDGKTVDFAQLRGRFVYLVFFSMDGKDTMADFSALRETYVSLSRKELEVVAVCCDPLEDRAKLEAFLKKAKLRWPVYHHGKPQEGDFAHKLNVRNLPAGYLFAPNGTLSRSGLAMRSVGGELRKYAAPVRK